MKLMWAIFKGSSYNNVVYESVIRNHRQLICDDEVDYLYNVMQDCKDLMRSEYLPPEHKWGWVEVQQALQNIKGVTLEELDRVEQLFDLCINVFGLRDVTKEDKKGGQLKNLVPRLYMDK